MKSSIVYTGICLGFLVAAILCAFYLYPPVFTASKADDITAFAVLMNKKYLHLRAYMRYKAGPDTALSPVSMRGDIRYDEFLRLDPGAPKVSLSRKPVLYSYEIKNRSDRTAGGPIIYNKYLWNSVPALVRTAGFDRIQDEFDRAKAVYTFLLAYHLHDFPPRGGNEKDLLEYLAHYGYGVCDDAAGAGEALLRAAGLKARIWALWGHVVPEAYVSGKWRLFDPDHRIYFHPEKDDRGVYGVEELAARRNRFDHYTSDHWGLEGAYPEGNKDIFQSTGNNKVVTAFPLKNDSVLEYKLRPGEKIVFANFNWGKFYMPVYHSSPLKRYYNGYFEYPAQLSAMEGGGGLVIAGTAGGLDIGNAGGSAEDVKLRFSSPFPIVGGRISAAVGKKTGDAHLVVLDRNRAKAMSFTLKDGENVFDWSNSMDTLQAWPVYSYTLGIKLQPGSRVVFSKLSIRTEFQFGKLALLELQQGNNSFNAYFPEGSGPGQFESRLAIRY